MSKNLRHLSGPISYPLTNDYMFRAIVQKSNNVLRHLIAAMLHIPLEEITSCTILNPIILGETINDKTCILDVKVILNNSKLINIEMQMSHLENWPDRAVFNLSRMYCNIDSGQTYKEILPAVHIGILKKSPFPDVNEFYSEYLMVNRKNMHVFTGKFSLYVLDLSQLDKLSEEEKQTELYDWARLFAATDWEEVSHLMEKNEAIKEAANYLYELTEDEKIKQQCEARELYYLDMSLAEKAGVDKGFKKGKAEGKAEGVERVNRLIRKLTQDNRIDDLIKSATDANLQNQLLQEYNL